MKRALLIPLLAWHAGGLACASAPAVGEPAGESIALQEARGAARTDIPAYVVADPSAAPVTAENLLENDRFWPFRAALVTDWTPPGGDEPLPQVVGALIRVHSSETLVLDFGRWGRHEVPVAVTDVIERANRVRTGETTKLAPNLVLTIGNKLLDPRSDAVSRFFIARDAAYRGILCVFADPLEEDFPVLADALRDLAAHEAMVTVLFPQGPSRDSAVWRRLREIDWKVPFVVDGFSGPYWRSIAGRKEPLPHLMLLTQNGRVLFEGGLSPGVSARIEAALPGAVEDYAGSPSR